MLEVFISALIFDDAHRTKWLAAVHAVELICSLAVQVALSEPVIVPLKVLDKRFIVFQGESLV